MASSALRCGHLQEFLLGWTTRQAPPRRKAPGLAVWAHRFLASAARNPAPLLHTLPQELPIHVRCWCRGSRSTSAQAFRGHCMQTCQLGRQLRLPQHVTFVRIFSYCHRFCPLPAFRKSTLPLRASQSAQLAACPFTCYKAAGQGGSYVLQWLLCCGARSCQRCCTCVTLSRQTDHLKYRPHEQSPHQSPAGTRRKHS